MLDAESAVVQKNPAKLPKSPVKPRNRAVEEDIDIYACITWIPAHTNGAPTVRVATPAADTAPTTVVADGGEKKTSKAIGMGHVCIKGI